MIPSNLIVLYSVKSLGQYFDNAFVNILAALPPAVFTLPLPHSVTIQMNPEEPAPGQVLCGCSQEVSVIVKLTDGESTLGVTGEEGRDVQSQ